MAAAALILGVLVGLWLLTGFGLIPWWAAVGGSLVVMLLAAWNLDRNRRSGARTMVKDANRPDYFAPMGNQTWQIPTAYIDHPTGTGPPPGVEDYDQRAAEVEGSSAGRERLWRGRSG